jgi:hypothetical protein
MRQEMLAKVAAKANNIGLLVAVRPTGKPSGGSSNPRSPQISQFQHEPEPRKAGRLV